MAAVPKHLIDHGQPGDWPPRATAIGRPEGLRLQGTSGQLWEVFNSQWYRVRDPEVSAPPLSENRAPLSLVETEQQSAVHYKAPRVSLDDIVANIAAEYYVTADQAVSRADNPVPIHEALPYLTICIMVMRNGFVVVGKSAPASPENFSAPYGQKLAHDDAIRQLWPLMGFALRDRLVAASVQHD